MREKIEKKEKVMNEDYMRVKMIGERRWQETEDEKREMMTRERRWQEREDDRRE